MSWMLSAVRWGCVFVAMFETLNLISSRAVMSACGLYRYRLWRDLGPGGAGTVLFVLLNPSTADSEQDDPTVRRCVGFAKSWGFARAELVNLFAFRSTSPNALATAVDPVGPENDFHLQDAARAAHRVVAAWGAHGTLDGRGDVVRGMLAPFQPLTFGLTKNGQPRHPLYLPVNTPVLPWSS